MAVLIVIGVLVLLGLGGLAIYGLLVYLQNSAKANIQLVKQARKARALGSGVEPRREFLMLVRVS